MKILNEYLSSGKQVYGRWGKKIPIMNAKDCT